MTAVDITPSTPLSPLELISDQQEHATRNLLFYLRLHAEEREFNEDECEALYEIYRSLRALSTKSTSELDEIARLLGMDKEGVVYKDVYNSIGGDKKRNEDSLDPHALMRISANEASHKLLVYLETAKGDLDFSSCVQLDLIIRNFSRLIPSDTSVTDKTPDMNHIIKLSQLLNNSHDSLATLVTQFGSVEAKNSLAKETYQRTELEVRITLSNISQGVRNQLLKVLLDFFRRIEDRVQAAFTRFAA